MEKKELREEQLNMEQSLDNNITSNKEDNVMENNMETNNEMNVEVTNTPAPAPEMVAAPKRKFNLGIIVALVAVIVLVLGTTVIAVGCAKKTPKEDPQEVAVVEPSETPEATVEPSEEPEVKVEPSEVPEEVVSEEPAEEPSEEPKELEIIPVEDLPNYGMTELRNTDFDQLGIYTLTEDENGEGILLPLDISSVDSQILIFLVYPENPTNIKFSDDQLDEVVGTYCQDSNFLICATFSRVTKTEDVTITVSYADGTVLEMTITLVAE